MTIGRHAHLYIDHQELQIKVAHNDRICHHRQYRIHRVCQDHTALTGDKLPQQHDNHRTLVLIRADRLAPQPRRICEFQSLKFSKRHTTLPAVGLLISWTANANDSNMVWDPLLITTLCILLKTSCHNRFSSTRCYTVNYDPPPSTNTLHDWWWKPCYCCISSLIPARTATYVTWHRAAHEEGQFAWMCIDFGQRKEGRLNKERGGGAIACRYESGLKKENVHQKYLL